MTFWIGLLLSVGVLAVLILTARRRRVLTAELGSVSEQWLSEHRGYERNYSER